MHPIIETYLNGNIKRARELFWEAPNDEIVQILADSTEIEDQKKFINLMFQKWSTYSLLRQP